jgi:hypothetical protein
LDPLIGMIHLIRVIRVPWRYPRPVLQDAIVPSGQG